MFIPAMVPDQYSICRHGIPNSIPVVDGLYSTSYCIFGGNMSSDVVHRSTLAFWFDYHHHDQQFFKIMMLGRNLLNQVPGVSGCCLRVDLDVGRGRYPSVSQRKVTIHNLASGLFVVPDNERKLQCRTTYEEHGDFASCCYPCRLAAPPCSFTFRCLCLHQKQAPHEFTQVNGSGHASSCRSECPNEYFAFICVSAASPRRYPIVCWWCCCWATFTTTFATRSQNSYCGRNRTEEDDFQYDLLGWRIRRPFYCDRILLWFQVLGKIGFLCTCMILRSMNGTSSTQKQILTGWR